MKYKLSNGKIVTAEQMDKLDDIIDLEIKGQYVYCNSQYFAEKIDACPKCGK